MEIHIACKEGSLNLVKYYLLSGFDINAKDNGLSLLHVAVLFRQKEVVKYLLEKDANVNIKDDYDYTALYYAKEEGYDDIVALLKEAGGEE